MNYTITTEITNDDNGELIIRQTNNTLQSHEEDLYKLEQAILKAENREFEEEQKLAELTKDGETK